MKLDTRFLSSNGHAKRQAEATTVWWTPQPGDAAYSAPAETPLIASTRTILLQPQTFLVNTPSTTRVRTVSSSSVKPIAASPTASTSAVTLDSLTTETETATGLFATSSIPVKIVASPSSSLLSSTSIADSATSPSNPRSTTQQTSTMPASSSATSSSASPAASAPTANNIGTLLNTIKHSPAYIVLASLVGLAIVVLLAAGIAFIVRRCCIRRKKARRAASTIRYGRHFDEFSLHDEKAGQWHRSDVPMAREKSNRAESFITNFQANREAAPLQEGLIVPSPAYLGSQTPSQNNGDWTWSPLSRSHSQSQDTLTSLPPRSVRSHHSADRLAHIGAGSVRSSDSRQINGPPTLRPISGFSASSSFGQDPSVVPWITVMGSDLDSPYSQRDSTSHYAEDSQAKSRFSSFSTQADNASKRASTGSNLNVPSAAAQPQQRRSSGLRQQLSRVPSTASSASIWSSSTGVTEQTFEPLSETEASSRFLKRHESLSVSSASSFRSGRVSLFRQHLSEGHVPEMSARSIAARRQSIRSHNTNKRASWEEIDDQDRQRARQTAQLLKQRFSADLEI